MATHDSVLCNTNPPALRAALDRGAHQVDIQFEIPAMGNLYNRRLTVRRYRPESFEGPAEVVLVFDVTATFITLALPPRRARKPRIRVERPDTVKWYLQSPTVGTSWIRLHVEGIENEMRWLGAELVDSPELIDRPGPFVGDPRLAHISGPVQRRLQFMLVTGRKIQAIKLLRHQIPGLGLREAKEFVEELSGR